MGAYVRECRWMPEGNTLRDQTHFKEKIMGVADHSLKFGNSNRFCSTEIINFCYIADVIILNILAPVHLPLVHLTQE